MAKVALIVPVRKGGGLALFPPLGLGYLASALRKAGHGDVGIIDCVREGYDIPAFRRRMEEEGAAVAGVSAWSLSVRGVRECLKALKGLERPPVTVIGGPHPSALGERAMQELPEADYGLLGEAERGLPLLLDHIEGRGGGPYGIPGLMWREGDSIRSNARHHERDLDSIAYPAWDLMRPGLYASRGTLIRKDTACIVTTRGCPFPCAFCSAHVTAGRPLRLRSIENVMGEIRMLMAEYGVRRFVVFDENITLRREHITGLCERIISGGIRAVFELPNGIRLDTLDPEMLGLMRRAGFSERVAVGIESGSERILGLMKKGLTKEGIREKVGLLKAAGFRPIGYFIIGYPTETRGEMEETVRFAIELKLYRAGFMPFHPLPGTESYDYLVRSGGLPADFDWETLSTDTVAYAPEGMTREALEAFRRLAILRFNLRPRVLWDYMRDMNSLLFAARKLKSIYARKPRHACRLGAATDGA